jgi:hypothetical protein
MLHAYIFSGIPSNNARYDVIVRHTGLSAGDRWRHPANKKYAESFGRECKRPHRTKNLRLGILELTMLRFFV